MQSEGTNLEGLSGALLLNPEQVLVFRDVSTDRLVGKQTARVSRHHLRQSARKVTDYSIAFFPFLLSRNVRKH